jgi:hypothetical protein
VLARADTYAESLTRAMATALTSGLGIVLVVGASPQRPDRQLSRTARDWPSHKKLAALARRAAANGDRHVDLTEPLALRIYVPGIDSALTYYSAVVLEPIAKETVVDEDDQLYTWYKCKLLATVSKIEHPLPSMAQALDAVPEGLLPDNLLPLQAGWILIPRRGGTVTVNDIVISSTDRSFPDFVLAQRYLVLLDFSPEEKVAVIPLQEVGVFRIDSDDRLSPLSSSDPGAQDIGF